MSGDSPAKVQRDERRRRIADWLRRMHPDWDSYVPRNYRNGHKDAAPPVPPPPPAQEPATP